MLLSTPRCSLPGIQGKRAASPPEGVHPCLALLPMGVAWPQALLPAPVVSYTTISPLLPKERYVSVARSGRSLRPGRYPAPCSVECGLSSPCEQGATTWLTWGLHHNMRKEFLIGGVKPGDQNRIQKTAAVQGFFISFRGPGCCQISVIHT